MKSAFRLPLLVSGVAVVWACLGTGSAAAAPTATPHDPADAVTPLLADDGSAYPAPHRMAAAEAAAGGPAPGWASAAQLQLLQRLHPSRVVRVQAKDGAPALPSSLAPDAWVFVEGQDEGAVRLARRLSDAGVHRVWVVLPGGAAAPDGATLHRGRPSPTPRSLP